MAIVLVMSAISMAGAAMAAGDATKGEALVRENCLRCHAIAPGDFRPHGEAPAFAEVAKRYPPSDLAEAFAEGVVVGHPDMPIFELTPQQLDDLIAFLESLR